MSHPTGNYIRMLESELDSLVDAKTLDEVHQILEIVLLREITEMEMKVETTSRCRQLQDSQLLAAASFSTSKKKGPQIH